MVPRCVFMQPSAIRNTGGSKSTTYIQNNFYGNSRSNNIWSGYNHHVCTPTYMPSYCPPRFAWAPSYVRNAMDRFMSFSLVSNMVNMLKPQSQQDELLYGQKMPLMYTTNQGQLSGNLTSQELEELNNRYQT